MLNGSHVSLKFTKDLRETLLPFHNAYVYSVFLEYDTASEDKGSCFVAVFDSFANLRRTSVGETSCVFGRNCVADDLTRPYFRLRV